MQLSAKQPADKRTTQTIGVDGCHAGWVAVDLQVTDAPAIRLYETAEALFRACTDQILIDIPIGLSSGTEGRACDFEARSFLGPGLGSRVFPAPMRATLSAETYAEASQVNEQVCGKKLPLQSYHILRKIREVDAQLQENPDLSKRVREAHPEIAFACLNLGKPLQSKKRTRGGHDERLYLISGYIQQFPAAYEQALQTYRRKDVARDDILDAAALALLPQESSQLSTLPAHPPLDATGLPMQIVYGVR